MTEAAPSPAIAETRSGRLATVVFVILAVLLTHLVDGFIAQQWNLHQLVSAYRLAAYRVSRETVLDPARCTAAQPARAAFVSPSEAGGQKAAEGARP